MKKIYLHVGLEKTGTTAIQGFLNTNRNELANSHNILYPKFKEDEIAMTSNHRIAKLFVPNQRISKKHIKISVEIFKQLLKEFETSKNFKTLIISSELFSYSTDTEIKLLKELLQRFNVTIILFLRRQDDYIESLYDQHIKLIWTSGRKPTPPEIFCNTKKLDFQKFVLNWYNSGFKNINIKIYGLSKDKDFIFKQFFENIDKTILQNRAIQQNKKNANPSLSLFHKTLLINYISRVNDDSLRKKMAAIIFNHNLIYSRANINQILNSKNHFSKQTKIELLQKYEQGNREILNLFPNAGYSKDSLFMPVEEFEKPLTINDLSKDEIMQSFFNLLLYFIKNFSPKNDN